MRNTGSARRSVVIAAFLPGALLGTQVAGLLFFLNPHLPFNPIPILRGVAFFSLLLGGLSLFVLLPFFWRKSSRAYRWLPWSLALVLAAAALGAWFHASYYSYFLPPGINRRLVKAGIWLSLAAVVSFYTALIHQVRQRPYGRRTQLFFVLMTLASIYIVLERREAFKPNLGPSPRATTFQGSPRPQLLVVGIEAATLDAILPLAEQGKLPFFSKMLAEGSYARLNPLVPIRRKSLWTTLISGKYPFQHGIVSENVSNAWFLKTQHDLSLFPVGVGFEYWGNWSRSRPVGTDTLRVLTLWEILSRLEISNALLGWPLTALSQGQSPPDGVEIGLSDLFFENSEDPGALWPEEIAERAYLFRTRWDELDPDLVNRFGTDPPMTVLRALLNDLWREDLAIFLLEQDPQIEALFLLLPGLHAVSKNYFGAYAAVQFEGEQNPDSERGAQLLSAYYIHLDGFLGEFWQKSSETRLMAVISAYGVEDVYGWRKAWQTLRRKAPLRGHFRRGSDGILMLLGDGVLEGTRINSAELADLVPTLLYGLGFPIARDLDGSVLTSAFKTSFLARQPLTFLPSYETFAIPEETVDIP